MQDCGSAHFAFAEMTMRIEQIHWNLKRNEQNKLVRASYSRVKSTQAMLVKIINEQYKVLLLDE